MLRIPSLLVFFIGLKGTPIVAADQAVLRLQMSPYTLHYHHKPEREHVWLVGLELQRETTLHGFAVLRNSFGQTSFYVYPWGGVHRNLFKVEPLFFKWSIGLLYGYKHPYEDKVPFNHNGFSPVIIPASGWAFAEGFSAQVNFLGTAGLMFQLSKDL